MREVFNLVMLPHPDDCFLTVAVPAKTILVFFFEGSNELSGTLGLMDGFLIHARLAEASALIA
jgi:hypothetical protein